MDIVACTDHGFVMPYGVLFKSICVNNSSNINFHVIVDGTFTDDDKEDLESIISSNPNNKIIYYYVSQDILDMLPTFPTGPSHVVSTTYLKLFFADILPKNLDKVLYLDGDMIVRKSLDDLWNTDISEVAVGYVVDQGYAQIKWYNTLEYPSELAYFNTGMILINLKYWREHQAKERFLEFIREHPERIFIREQDVMSYTFREEKIELPLTYNFQCGFLYKRRLLQMDWFKYKDQIEKYKKDPCIIHYLTADKPWFKGNNNPYRSEFYKYKSMTKWKNVPLRSSKPKREKVIDKLVEYARKCHILKPIPSSYDDDNLNPLNK